MAKKEGIDDIIKGAAKLIGKATKKGASKGAKEVKSTVKKVGKKPSVRTTVKKVGKKPPVRPKAVGKPPAGPRPLTRGGMTAKELDAYRSKTYHDSRNYFENAKAYRKDAVALAKKNQPKKRGDWK